MALTCRDLCKPLPLFLVFWGLRVTDYHGLQQTSSKIGAFLDTNCKLLLMGVLGASEGIVQNQPLFLVTSELLGTSKKNKKRPVLK